MATTTDQMNKNQRYNDRYTQEQSMLSKDDDGTGAFGRRVYLESPSLGNKEEEDMYRYVPSRLSENPASVIGHVPPITTAATGATLMDTLDFELDLLGTNNPGSRIPPYGTLSQPVATKPLPVSDPRQDPLLGPLLAELDAMTSTQPVPSASIYPRSTVPSYESNLLRTNALSQPNLTNTANRTINDALLDAELYGTLPTNPQQQQRQTRPPVRSTSMNPNESYMPSSYPYEPASFLSQFGSEDQLFQRPSLNNLGQNYVSNPTRTRDPSGYVPTSYTPAQQQYQPPSPRQRYPSDNQEMFFTDHHGPQTPPPPPPSLPPPPPPHFQYQQQQHHEEDSKRQAVWNDLQRTNQHKQRDSAKQPKSNASWHPPNSQHSSLPASKTSSQHQYRPSVGTKVNHIDDNIEMIRNKENSYHRSPTKRYEPTYARRKEQEGYNNNYDNRYEHDSQVPVAPTDYTQSSSPGRTVAVPLNSQINRVGDKISLNIDLQLVDVQNPNDSSVEPAPQWSGLDPLDRHIRKLERSIDQSLPNTNPPVRNPTIPNTGSNSSPNNRMARSNRTGYNPPLYANERPQEEDSYLAKLNYARKNPSFKPYTGKDYEDFKKNYGFGTGNLGFNSDHTTYKEKTEKFAKTREYAQQVEARNKKKLSSPQRTWSDTRISGKPTHHGQQRLLDDTHIVLNHSQHRPRHSGTSTHSLPTALHDKEDEIPRRRPTEIFTLPKELPVVRMTRRNFPPLPPLPPSNSKRRN